MLQSDHVCISEDVDDLIDLVNNQPTAYDPEKVVEQLEDKREEMLRESEFDNTVVNHFLEYADEMIDIVRNSGKE